MRAIDGCDAVVHTAGVVSFRPGMEAQLLEVNGRGVEVVLGAALAAKVSRAVLPSSTAVLGGTRRPVVADESTPGNAEALGIPYFTSKLAGERAALALHARGLPVVVVRPAYVLGPGDVHLFEIRTSLPASLRTAGASTGCRPTCSPAR